MLLTEPQSNGSLSVMDDLTSTIELIPSQARLQRIDLLLGPTLYAGPDAEEGLLAGKVNASLDTDNFLTVSIRPCILETT